MNNYQILKVGSYESEKMDDGPYEGIVDRYRDSYYFYSVGDIGYFMVAELLFRTAVAQVFTK